MMHAYIGHSPILAYPGSPSATASRRVKRDKDAPTSPEPGPQTERLARRGKGRDYDMGT